MSEKTHFRKAFDSPYLSSADIVEPTVLKIARVALEKDKTKKTKDSFNTIYWAQKELRPGEELKPMILNSTNSKTMKNLTGSPWIEDWAGVDITVYVDQNVRFGRETVEGLRISSEKPVQRKPELTEADKQSWEAAIARYIKDGHLRQVEMHRTISPTTRQAIIDEASKRKGGQQ